MSGVVASLFGGPTGEPCRNEGCVSVLRDALTRAENGDVVGVVVVRMHADGLASCEAAGPCASYNVIGGLEVAKAALIASCTDE